MRREVRLRNPPHNQRRNIPVGPATIATTGAGAATAVGANTVSGVGHGTVVGTTALSISTAPAGTAPAGTTTGQSVTSTLSQDQHQHHNDRATGIPQITINAPTTSRDPITSLGFPDLGGDYLVVDVDTVLDLILIDGAVPPDNP